MTDTITDPQEQALMQAVVEAALADYAFALSDEEYSTTGIKLDSACEALKAYRAKSSSPEPAPLLPCPFCGNAANLISGGGEIEGWSKIECNACCCEMEYSSDEMVIARWNTRHSPCLPDTRPSPVTDEQITKVWREHRFGNGVLDHHAFARDLLALAHFSPTQTITPVEPEITDEKILKLGHKLFCYVGDDSNNCADIIEFARAILARHTPTSISNSTLDKIQSIAKTREPEQFRNECRDMLRGGG